MKTKIFEKAKLIIGVLLILLLLVALCWNGYKAGQCLLSGGAPVQGLFGPICIYEVEK